LNNGDQSRSAIVGEAKKKKAASAAKKSRRKYKKLEEAKLAQEALSEDSTIAAQTGAHKRPEEKTELKPGSA